MSVELVLDLLLGCKFLYWVGSGRRVFRVPFGGRAGFSLADGVTPPLSMGCVVVGVDLGLAFSGWLWVLRVGFCDLGSCCSVGVD